MPPPGGIIFSPCLTTMHAPPPWGGPTSLPFCHWPPPLVGGPIMALGATASAEANANAFPSSGHWPPLVGGPIMALIATASAEASANAFPPTLFFGALSPPKRGGMLPHKGPPHLGGANHGTYCYIRPVPRQVRVLSLPPFFLVPYPPQNGGECCHTKGPPTFGGAQLRGGSSVECHSCHCPPLDAGGPGLYMENAEAKCNRFVWQVDMRNGKKKEKVIRMSFDFLFRI